MRLGVQRGSMGERLAWRTLETKGHGPAGAPGPARRSRCQFPLQPAILVGAQGTPEQHPPSRIARVTRFERLEERTDRLSSRLFVGNLAYGVSEDELRRLFASVGEVASARLITDRQTGQPRGFAFVEMASDEDTQKAVSQLNGRELQGRAINVAPARPREEGGGRGPGGGRPGGGGPRRGPGGGPRRGGGGGRGRRDDYPADRD